MYAEFWTNSYLIWMNSEYINYKSSVIKITRIYRKNKFRAGKNVKKRIINPVKKNAEHDKQGIIFQ